MRFRSHSLPSPSDVACVQTCPISFVARATKEIGDVCTQATSDAVHSERSHVVQVSCLGRPSGDVPCSEDGWRLLIFKSRSGSDKKRRNRLQSIYKDPIRLINRAKRQV